jgi:hypothetical protein
MNTPKCSCGEPLTEEYEIQGGICSFCSVIDCQWSLTDEPHGGALFEE